MVAGLITPVHFEWKEGSMPDVSLCKYRAFLSYSRADRDTAKRIQRHLEAFRIDPELVGCFTALGTVPKTLRPIFGRIPLPGLGALFGNRRRRKALDASAALIVLASRRAARSRRVNEEVRRFKARHPDRPVIPLIVDGDPGDAGQECFPPALRAEAASYTGVADATVAMIAVDMRENGDGFELAITKLVALLLGLPVSHLVRRLQRRRWQQVRRRAAVGAWISVAAAIAGAFFWHSRLEKRMLTQVAAQVESASAAARVLAIAPAPVVKSVATTTGADNAAADLYHAQTLEIVADRGSPQVMETPPTPVVMASAMAVQEPSLSCRSVAAVAAVSGFNWDREVHAEPALLEVSDLWGLFRNGWRQEDAGQLEAAQAAFARVIATAKPGSDDEALFWSQIGAGDIQAQRGNLAGALAAYQRAHLIAERMTKAEPGTALWERQLAVSYNKIGDALVDQNGLMEALEFYRSGNIILDRLATADPGNQAWQRDLAASCDNIGRVMMMQGEFADAVKAYRDGLVIRDELIRIDPGNASWQRELATSYENIGDVLAGQEEWSEALTSYREGLGIRARFAETANPSWRRELAISHINVGDVLAKQGRHAEALKFFRDAMAIVDRLARTDPANAIWRRDLSLTNTKIGDVLASQGNTSEALKAYRDGLAIRDRSARSAPDDALWQRDLVVSCVKVAETDRSQAKVMLLRAAEVAHQMQSRGLLAPRDSWIPGEIARRIAALPQ
jgi:tetratricopeptide (TPR) repeat protein